MSTLSLFFFGRKYFLLISFTKIFCTFESKSYGANPMWTNRQTETHTERGRQTLNQKCSFILWHCKCVALLLCFLIFSYFKNFTYQNQKWYRQLRSWFVFFLLSALAVFSPLLNKNQKHDNSTLLAVTNEIFISSPFQMALTGGQRT